MRRAPGKGLSTAQRLALALWLIAAVPACTAGSDPEAGRQAPAALVLGPCTAPEGQSGLESARCGRYRVPENRATGAGPTLELNVVVLPATVSEPRPDPIFFLAGGPGEAATRLVSRFVDSWMRRERDLVFVDQRGSNGDHRLGCRPEPESSAQEAAGEDGDLQRLLGPLFDLEEMRVCREHLAGRADLTQYSTPIAMDDLDEIRAALGYDQINLIGGSYGTRASLVFMRRHPERVRAAVLRGSAPLAFTNPLFHARSAQTALDAVLARCAGDEACAAAFPNLGAEVQQILERLGREPAQVTVAHPETDEPQTLKLSREAFAEALRVMMYRDSTIVRVPLLLHQATAGDFQPFAERALQVNQNLRTVLPFGMLLSVTCSEDVDRIDPAAIPEATAGTFLGDHRVVRQKAACEGWPRSDLPEGYGDPVAVQVPTLVLSGAFDPVTSPRWGEETARHLPQSRHLVVPTAHTVRGPCVDQITEDFLKTASVEGLATSCAEQMELAPFELN